MFIHVLAFTQRPELKIKIEKECKSIPGLSPIFHHNLKELESTLNTSSMVDIFIIDEPLKSSEFHQLYDLVQTKKKLFTNLMVMSESDKLLDGSSHFKTAEPELLLQSLNSLLNSKKDTNAYFGAPLDLLVHFEYVPFDLYIKLSDGKYLKRIPAFEKFEPLTLERYQQKGISEFYMLNEHKKDFSKMLISNMVNKVDQEYTSNDAKQIAVNEVFKTTSDIVSSLGIKPRVVEICESIIDSLMEDVSKNTGQLSTYMQGLKKMDYLSFNYRFIHLSSFIASQIVDGLNKQDKIEDLKRVVFAAFFCDMGMKDPTHVHFRKPDSISGLSEIEQFEINQHAMASSKLLENYPNAPAGVDIIVRQHHGSWDGRNLTPSSAKLGPLPLCLMAAQELSYQILSHADQPVCKVIGEVFKQHRSSPLKPYLDVFEGTCLYKLKETA